MDNWVTFLVVNVVLVIVLGVFTNLATPWVKSAWDKSVFSSRQKRIKALVADYRYIKDLRSDREYAGIVLIGRICRRLMGITILITYTGYNIFWLLSPSQHSSEAYAIARIFVGIYGSYIFWELGSISTDVNSMTGGFNKYKEKTIAKIKKLGGNPEDLDEEEEN